MSTENETGSGFYNDPQKLTYDQAKRLVERYLRDDVQRSITRVDHVLRSEGFPCDEHNQHRVREMLLRRCEPFNVERNGPMQFKIPERYRA